MASKALINRAQHCHNRNRQKQAGKRHQNIQGTHDHIIHPAADKPGTGDGAQQAADNNGKGDRRNSNLQGQARAKNNAGEHVAAVAVDPHQMLGLVSRAAQQVDTGGIAAFDIFQGNDRIKRSDLFCKNGA